MGIEVVTIQVGGQRWRAFKSVTIRAAYNEAARSFSFVVAAETGAAAANKIFQKGVEVSIYLNSDLVLKGNVNRKQPKMTPKSFEISVSGRSASADLVDGSAEHDKGSFKKKDPKEIGDEISKKYKKTGFRSKTKLDKVDQYQLTQGETVFRCVEKLCREQGITLTGTADGYIELANAKNAERHAGGLYEGKNIIEATADHNDSNQHSEITVRGQRPFGHGVDNLEIEAIAKAAGVGRHRPLVVVIDSDTTKDRAKKRAKTRRDREAGEGLKATISTQGFRDQGGKLWTPGNLVWVQSEMLDIAQDMLIESVDYAQDDGGSITSLSLTDPRSFGGEGGKGNKSGAEWGVDSSEAE